MPRGATSACASWSSAPTPPRCASSTATMRGLTQLCGAPRHQGVVARVTALQQTPFARRPARCRAGPAAAAGAGRRDRPAQPGRLPARGRRRRRACGDRAEGPCGGPERHRRQGGQRRGRDRALPDGHQPGAHAERAEGARHPHRRHQRRCAEHAVRRRPVGPGGAGAGRRRQGPAPAHAQDLRRAGAHPDARRGRKPERLGGRGVCLYEALRQRAEPDRARRALH